MTEAIAACISYPLIVGLMVCYVAGVPTPAQFKQLFRLLFKPNAWVLPAYHKSFLINR